MSRPESPAGLRLTSLSFAHPVVASERRALLFLAGSPLDRAHQRLRASALDVFILSTCLRVELAWIGGEEQAAEVLDRLYGDRSLSDEAVLRTDREAFVHLCRVVAGLESPVVGEPEVLGQFRRAADTRRQAAVASGDLGRTLEAAIGVGRTARRLLQDSPRGSLAALAAAAAAPSGRVAILGGGTMARAAAANLGGIDVTVFARRPVHIGGAPVRRWELAPEALVTFPAVISAVAAKGALFPPDVVNRAFARRTEPLLLIDLGMPPGFVGPVTETVRYLGVDDLADSVRAQPPAREAEASLAQAAATAWARISAADRVVPVIAAILEQAETAVGEEVRRFAGRLARAEEPERVLEQLARTVARRVLHPPISFLSSSERGAELSAVLAEAFGVADD